MKKRRITALLLTAVMAIGLVGCGSSSASSAEESTSEQAVGESGEESVVTIGMVSPWTMFNPLGDTNSYNKLVGDQVFDQLFFYKSDLTTSPRLADSYEYADDSTSMTIHINEDAVFSDGEPVTADDIIFSLRLSTKEGFVSNMTSHMAYLEGTDDTGIEVSEDSAAIEKVDDHTVKLSFKQAVPENVILFDMLRETYIFPEHLLGDKTIDELNDAATWNDNFVGSGPYVFDSKIDGQQIEFVANEEYYLGAPEFDRLIVKVVEQNQLLSSLLSGEIDAVAGCGLGNLSVDDWETAVNTEGITTDEGRSYTPQVMFFNNERLDNARVRYALNLAINKDAIVDQLYKGLAAKLYTAFPSYSSVYDEEIDYPDYDPDQAKQILEEEGFDFTQTLELAVPTGNELRIRSASIIQQNYADIGVNVEITEYDFATIMANLRAGEYDLGLLGGISTPEPSTQTTFYTNHGADNFALISDPTYDELTAKAKYAVDADERQEYYNELQEYAVEDSPISYLYATYNLFAYNSDKLDNVDPSLFTDFHNWAIHTWKAK